MNLFQPIDYEGFHLFMETYLEADIGEDLCRHLFLSFNKKSPTALLPQGGGNKEFGVKDVAAVASQTVCAPITHQTTEIHVDNKQERSGLAEKLHGITEKLHSLGHSGDKGKLICKY
jgi:diacylglycerol kinase (ATP)